MTEPREMLPMLDTAPRGGVFRHLEDAPLTEAEIAAGNALGEAIDPDDDEDAGPQRFGISGNQLHAAQDLRTALLDWGVPRVSIELQPGAAGATNRSIVTTFRRAMSHHIVSRPSQGLTPGLALVKRGRPDLAGPLCNGYGGFDRCYRIITMSWANHPGAGGPWPGWGGTVPRDNGRPYIWGTEYEGGLEPWTDAMHEFMARANGGVLQWLGAPLDCHGEHADPWAKGRKIDRLGYTAAAGRQRIAALLEGLGDDMSAKAEQQVQEIHTAVAEIRRQIMGPLEEGQGRSLVQSLNWWLTQDGSPLLMAAARAGDPDAMAAALANALGPRLAEQLRGVAGLTQQQALDASKQAVREVLGGLD